MYDWTHGQSDFIEQISHSLCSLEFKPHRELYNLILKQTQDKKPKASTFQNKYNYGEMLVEKNWKFPNDQLQMKIMENF